MTKPSLLMLFLLVIGEGETQSRGRNCRLANGSSGLCIPVSDCPPLRQLLALIRSGTAPQGSLSTIRSAICSFDNNKPLVCCESPVSPTPGPAAPLPISSTVHSTSSGKCGIPGITDATFGLVNPPLTFYKWQVVLRGNNGTRSSWFCGGSLISDRYVLTAAHCFKENLGINLEFARIGEYNLDTNVDCVHGKCAPPVQDIAVESIIRHPSYGSPCDECNDIALLRLAQRPILHPSFVMPICLPRDPVREMGFSTQEFQGKLGGSIGWGIIAGDPTENHRSGILQHVDLPIGELSDCGFLNRNYPDSNMVICAVGKGKDICRVDSGGPLTLTNMVATRYFLVGVTSSRPTVCGSASTPGLYTNVSHYMSWINSTMEP